MRILVAEDDTEVRQLLEVTLGASGHEVTAVEDGQAAIEALSGRLPDVVVLDVMMPGRDGIDVLRHIRSSDTIGDLPVVMLTAKVSEDDHLRAFEAGADAYLTKPFDPDDLDNAVLTVANRSADQRAEHRERERQRAHFFRRLEQRF